MKDYLKLAKNIIEKHDLQKYVDILLNYWEENPPTLGHGFAHVLKVAVEAYEIGELNEYSHPVHLFIGGLFHDVYRPAEGKDGDEDQYLSLMITVELFYKNNIDPEIATKVLHAIESHDSWRGKENVPQYDLLLSVADKVLVKDGAYPYAWASNKYSVERVGKPIYKSYLQLTYGFIKYEQRAWEVLMKHPVKGFERATESYTEMTRSICEKYLNDPGNETFAAFLEEKANEFKKDERDFLKAFTSDDKVLKIMSDCL